MRVHLRVRRWVAGWIAIGVFFGAIALVNILGHHLTPVQDRILLLMGAAHWLLGGVVCWAFEGVKFEAGRKPSRPVERIPEPEYHSASEFLLPGNRRSLLPWRH